jgi:hypothetical protein
MHWRLKYHFFAAAFRNERPPDLPNALGIKESPSFRQNGASECLSNWDFRKDEEKPFIWKCKERVYSSRHDGKKTKKACKSKRAFMLFFSSILIHVFVLFFKAFFYPFCAFMLFFSSILTNVIFCFLNLFSIPFVTCIY